MSLCSRFNPEIDDNFPCSTELYTHCVGRLLVGVLKIIFQELGFSVIANHQQSNGADMIVSVDAKKVFALEIINWNITSRLNDKRRNCIIENLLIHNCKRIFVFTNYISENQLFEITKNDIHLVITGFQLLRKPCYDYFQETNRIRGRVIYNNQIKSVIKRKILDLINSEYYALSNLRYLFS